VRSYCNKQRDKFLFPISINEKIYVFLWFWLVGLSAITVASLVYHVFFMVTPGDEDKH